MPWFVDAVARGLWALVVMTMPLWRDRGICGGAPNSEYTQRPGTARLIALMWLQHAIGGVWCNLRHHGHDWKREGGTSWICTRCWTRFFFIDSDPARNADRPVLA